jgi:predicted membrane-bound spermidine synthase
MKPFTVIAIVIFALGSLLHLLRYFLGWEIIIHTVSIPTWVSLLGFVIAGGLAFMLWREMKS